MIYGNNGKLVFNVNVPDVAHASPFDCAAFPDSLALCSDADLIIGGVDDIQKLHVRAVPLGEQPRRIAHQPATKTFAVLTQRENVDGARIRDEHFVRLLDAETFETKHSYPLLPEENDGAVVSCRFADDDATYYAVGTAFTAPEEVEPSRGRVLVFKVVRDELVLVAEKEVKGAVYNLNAFNGKLWRSTQGAALPMGEGRRRRRRRRRRRGAVDAARLATTSSSASARTTGTSWLCVQVRGDLIVGD